MKTNLVLFAACAALLVVFSACSKRSEVDTTKLEASFSTADPADKSHSDKAVASIKAGDYTAALDSLKNLAQQAKLTQEQKDAIKDVTDQVQKQLGAAIEKAAESGQKALEDAKKSLPK